MAGWRRDLSAAPVVVAVEALTRAPEYQDISFTIRKGEIVGLTGRTRLWPHRIVA